jgi:hypothetical protein
MTRTTYLLWVSFLLQCVFEILFLIQAATVTQVRLALFVVPLAGWFANDRILKDRTFLAWIMAATALVISLFILFWGWDAQLATKQLRLVSGAA